MITVRRSEISDAVHLKKWLSDPQISQWFPMDGPAEVDDSVNIWAHFNKLGSGLTAIYKGEISGMAVLNLQSFLKLQHTCLFSIIVEEGKRGLGIGTTLIHALEGLAKKTFSIEILHLEVYAGNPAEKLYKKLGYTTFGVHKKFAREETGYRDKVFMQKRL